MVKVVKRNGQKVDFDKEKIKIAIEKAMNSPNGVYIENQAEKIADEIEKRAENKREISIYQIEDQVYYKLIDKKILQQQNHTKLIGQSMLIKEKQIQQMMI